MQQNREKRKASMCPSVPAERCLVTSSPARQVFPREEKELRELVSTRVGLYTLRPEVWGGCPFWGGGGGCWRDPGILAPVPAARHRAGEPHQKASTAAGFARTELQVS